MAQLVLPNSRLAKWHMLRRNARRSKVHLLKNATHVNELLTRQLFGICSWSLQAEYDVINVEYKTALVQVNHQTQKKTNMFFWRVILIKAVNIIHKNTAKTNRKTSTYIYNNIEMLCLKTTYAYIRICMIHVYIPVVPNKAVAEVSKIGDL